MSGIKLSMRVWDAPTRLFHWAVVLLVGLGWISWHQNWAAWHFRFGYALLALLLFRLAWGFVGSETARFTGFLLPPPPAKGRKPSVPAPRLGHTRTSGAMLLLFLLLLLVLTVAGLFDPGVPFPPAPFAPRIGAQAAADLGLAHRIVFYLVLAATAAHLLLLAARARSSREPPWRPMLTGKQRLPAATRPPRMASPLLALLVLAAAALAVGLSVTRLGH